MLRALANVCHSFRASNNQIYSDDEFDLWPVFSGEQIVELCPC